MKVAYFAESPADQAALTILPYTKRELKRQVSATSHPSLALELEMMKAEAARLAADLSAIHRLFPHGFGALLRNLKSWDAGL